MRSSMWVMGVVITACSVIGASAWTSRPARAQQRANPAAAAHDVRAISALNDCIEERFKDVNEGFGLARIVAPGNRAHRFRPENVREMTAVRALEQAHLQVVFYLVGRSGIVKGPVEITQSRAHDAPSSGPPPPAQDLSGDSQRAMRVFRASESHEFVNSGWKFVARPVRASEELCLRCHRPSGGETLQLGDAIGAAMYGYRTTR